MTTDTIIAAAKASFSAYYGHRTWHSWDTCGNATNIRWEYLAARVLNGNITRTQDLHDEYNQDHAHPVDWADISTPTRDRWVQAWTAMIRVRDAAERVAA